jgi:hypothetical protein
MRPQRKRMIVETTRAFVKLKQNKAAVSAGGTKFAIKIIACHSVSPSFSPLKSIIFTKSRHFVIFIHVDGQFVPD